MGVETGSIRKARVGLGVGKWGLTRGSGMEYRSLLTGFYDSFATKMQAVGRVRQVVADCSVSKE